MHSDLQRFRTKSLIVENFIRLKTFSAKLFSMKTFEDGAMKGVMNDKSMRRIFKSHKKFETSCL